MHIGLKIKVSRKEKLTLANLAKSIGKTKQAVYEMVEKEDVNTQILKQLSTIILKKVQPSPKEGILMCHSLNPNGRYKDFDVPMREIRAIYKVLACVSMR